MNPLIKYCYRVNFLRILAKQLLIAPVFYFTIVTVCSSQDVSKGDFWRATYNFDNMVFAFDPIKLRPDTTKKFFVAKNSVFKVFLTTPISDSNYVAVKISLTRKDTKSTIDRVKLYCVLKRDLGIFAVKANRKDNSEMFSTLTWLNDDLTIGFGNSNTYFAGIRFIFEPQLGVPLPQGDNKFVVTQLSSLPRWGLETNLFKGYLSFQALAFFPSLITFDDQSPVVVNKVILKANQVKTDFSYGLGLSFLDGIFAVGYGHLYFDHRDFDRSNPYYKPSQTQSGFWYINIQPVSAFRKALKQNPN